MPGYAPESGNPLHGYTLEPHAKAALVIGLAQTRAGRHAFRGVAVSYSAGSRDVESVFDLGVRLCAPENRFLHKCPTPLTEPPGDL